MPNYNNGKIYIVKSKNTDKVYIGSTCRTLEKRLSGHYVCFKRWLNYKSSYVTIFELLAEGECYIELLENFPCSNDEELRAREGYYQKKIKCCNHKVEGRTRQEHYQDNKKEILEKGKEYRKKNSEKMKKYHRQYTQSNKERIKEVRKKYRERRKDHIAQKVKEYQDKNIDKIREQQREKKYCEICKCEVRKYDFKRHLNTKKHKDNLAQIKQ